MDVEFHAIGKKFQKNWVFKDLDYKLESSKAYAITGPNGSGKSTLLQITSGIIPPTKGDISYEILENEKKIPISADNIYKYLGFASPYMQLIEEYSLAELLKFHFSFKKATGNISQEEIIEKMYLTDAKHKLIKNFSSGMKQRLKLGLCFYTENRLLLLDEPTTNLDEKGIDWYMQEVTKLVNKKLIVISSNIRREYEFCHEIIDLLDFKE